MLRTEGFQHRSQRGGRHLQGGVRFCVLTALLLVAASGAAADRLGEVRNLAEAGAPRLALRIVLAEQPAPDDPAWPAWEERHLDLLAATDAWEALVERVEGYPPDLSPAFLKVARERRAEALLALGRAAEARAGYEALIAGDGRSPRLTAWRAGAVRASLKEGRLDEAHQALVGLLKDHVPVELRLDVARGWLEAGRPERARELLQGASGGEADLLALLARLRLQEPAKAVLPAARTLAEDLAQDDATRALGWAVVAEAAGALGDLPSRIMALEELFSRTPQPSRALFPTLTPDALWEGYRRYASEIGKREGLPKGDGAWLKAARASWPMYPVRGRSLLAYLARPGKGGQPAQSELADRIVEMPNGHTLLRRLFLDAPPFAQPASIAPSIRWRLADKAVERGDEDLARRLLQGLEPASDDLVTRMRQGKILLLAGQRAEGVRVIESTLPLLDGASGEELDHFLQLLFDLQTVNEHEIAVASFEALFRTTPLSLQRELLYWMGDSRRAQGRHIEAARLYLRSAALDPARGGDRWAQTARYQAARSLSAAELWEDSVALYDQLLKATDDPARRAVLRRELDDLRLRGVAR